MRQPGTAFSAQMRDEPQRPLRHCAWLIPAALVGICFLLHLGALALALSVMAVVLGALAWTKPLEGPSREFAVRAQWLMLYARSHPAARLESPVPLDADETVYYTYPSQRGITDDGLENVLDFGTLIVTSERCIFSGAREVVEFSDDDDTFVLQTLTNRLFIERDGHRAPQFYTVDSTLFSLCMARRARSEAFEFPVPPPDVTVNMPCAHHDGLRRGVFAG